MKKNIIVLWTGGLDSTYALLLALSDSENYVRSVYLRINNNDGKVAAEIAATEAMRPYFEKYENYGGHTVAAEILMHEYGETLMLKQPLLFLTAAAYAVRIDTHEVHLAYVMNDDAVSFLQEISELWACIMNLHHKKQLAPKLVFPLTKWKKEEISRDLIIHAPLIENIWWCETPDSGEPCGHCAPCNRYADLASRVPAIDMLIKNRNHEREG